MDVMIVLPYVGAGTSARPYQLSFAPLTVSGQARLIRSGFTCFRRELGGAVDPDNDPPYAALAKQSLSTATNVADVGGYRIVSMTIVAGLEDAFLDLAGYLWAPDLDLLGGRCRDVRTDRVGQLAEIRPDLDWADPDQAAAELLGDLGGTALADQLRSWWTAVLSPTVSTAMFFGGMVADNVANYDLVDTLDVTSLLSPVGLGDAAFEVLVAGEIGRWLGVF